MSYLNPSDIQKWGLNDTGHTIGTRQGLRRVFVSPPHLIAIHELISLQLFQCIVSLREQPRRRCHSLPRSVILSHTHQNLIKKKGQTSVDRCEGMAHMAPLS